MLLVEGWFVFGVVTVVTGMIWTARLSRQAEPENAKMPARTDHQFGSSSFSNVHSA